MMNRSGCDQDPIELTLTLSDGGLSPSLTYGLESVAGVDRSQIAGDFGKKEQNTKNLPSTA